MINKYEVQCVRENKQLVGTQQEIGWETGLIPLKDICDRKMFSLASFVPARMPLVSYNSVVFRENICGRKLCNL